MLIFKEERVFQEKQNSISIILNKTNENCKFNGIKYVEGKPYIFNYTILCNTTLGYIVDYPKFNNIIDLLDLRESLYSKV